MELARVLQPLLDGAFSGLRLPSAVLRSWRLLSERVGWIEVAFNVVELGKRKLIYGNWRQAASCMGLTQSGLVEQWYRFHVHLKSAVDVLVIIFYLNVSKCCCILIQL